MHWLFYQVMQTLSPATSRACLHLVAWVIPLTPLQWMMNHLRVSQMNHVLVVAGCTKMKTGLAGGTITQVGRTVRWDHSAELACTGNSYQFWRCQTILDLIQIKKQTEHYDIWTHIILKIHHTKRKLLLTRQKQWRQQVVKTHHHTSKFCLWKLILK